VCRNEETGFARLCTDSSPAAASAGGSAQDGQACEEERWNGGRQEIVVREVEAKLAGAK
jgi:hypothetical protein